MRSGQYVKQVEGYSATVRLVEKNLQCAYVTANKTLEQFVELGFLKEITGWQRNRLYRYQPYLALFQPLKLTTPM